MKSLIAVLALTLALGAGYWKMQNPEGGLPEAQTQASAVLQRAMARARAGYEAISTDGSDRATLETQLEEKLNNQANATDSRLSALQQASDDTASKIEQRLNALEQQLGSANNDSQQQLSALEQALSAGTEQLAGFESRLDELSQRQSESIESGMAAFKSTVETELDNLKAGNQNSSIALDSFTEKLASLDTRLNTLSSAAVSASASETAADGNEAAESAANLDSRLAAVTAQLDQRLAAMEERLAAATSADTRTTLDTLAADLGAASEKLAKLDSIIEQNQASTQQLTESMQTELASLKSDLQTLQSTVESSAIENTQNDLREQLSNLERLVKSAPENNSEITAISSALEQSRERIASLEQRVTDLPASSDTDSAKLLQEELQQQISELESRLASASSAPAEEIVSTLSAVQQKVSELESKDYVTTEDIERLSETKSIQYKIYFSTGSVNISEEAAKVLDSMIAQEANRATNISIFGTTDRSGSFEFNQQLALRRANRVRSYLIQNGFEFTKIRDVDGIGEDLAASILPDGQNDPNQRSVIIFAFQP